MSPELALVAIVVLLWGPTMIWILYRVALGRSDAPRLETGRSRGRAAPDPESAAKAAAAAVRNLVDERGYWVCTACMSVNRPEARRCYGCKAMPGATERAEPAGAQADAPVVPVMAERRDWAGQLMEPPPIVLHKPAVPVMAPPAEMAGVAVGTAGELAEAGHALPGSDGTEGDRSEPGPAEAAPAAESVHSEPNPAGTQAGAESAHAARDGDEAEPDQPARGPSQAEPDRAVSGTQPVAGPADRAPADTPAGDPSPETGQEAAPTPAQRRTRRPRARTNGSTPGAAPAGADGASPSVEPAPSAGADPAIPAGPPEPARTTPRDGRRTRTRQPSTSRAEPGRTRRTATTGRRTRSAGSEG